jgi:hypothetical protein
MRRALASGSQIRPAGLLARILGLSLLASAALVAGDGQERASTYGVGSWDPESGLGNHRAVIHVAAPPAAKPSVVQARIPWRRRDFVPAAKNVVVVDATTGERITNVLPLVVLREFGLILFEPRTVPGDYHIYFMPYSSEGRKNYPNVKYDPPEASEGAAWAAAARAYLVRNDISLGQPPLFDIPRAEFVELQSADAFSAFTPMELIATAAETNALLASHPDAPYLLFPEDRTRSVRMTRDLPARWAVRGPGGAVRGDAARGEYFAFQIGVWAAREPIPGLEVRFSDLERTEAKIEDSSPAAQTLIPANAMTCFNRGGVGWDGAPFAKDVAVEKGRVQALWCGVQVPRDAEPGVFNGTVTIAPAGLPETVLALELRVTEDVLEDAGDGDPYRMTRLRWLDSRLAQDDGIVPPYTAMAVDGATIGCLGRSLTIGPDGLPARIRSFFAPEMTRFGTRAFDVLAAPMKLVVADAAGRPLTWASAEGASGLNPNPVLKGPGTVAWEARNKAGDLVITVEARMEFDGFVDCKVAIAARRETVVSDIRLEAPFAEEIARYMMGLGFKGGLRPEAFDWAWDQQKNQDALWIGTINAGMQIGLRAENYARPLNTNFYLSKPLNMPPSWWNEGRGRITVREAGPGAAPGVKARSSGGAVVMTASSGPRVIKAGETLHFDFTLLVTPFKSLDPQAHFGERYYHAFKPLDEVAESGANVVNVHHANAINPYINYPFLRAPEMKAYIDDAHRRGFKVKIYDTIRELSNRAPELFALRSLGHEIFSPGPGGGYSWLQEHLDGDYIAAWFVPDLKDAAVINSGMSRWHNYYIEGLDWLARNVGIDGLYLDDVAFDRTTMKRVRKVLDRNRPGALIDLHSANQYNVRDGFASSANLYLEHFPYLNRLWFGEYFDYNGSGPDYWLVELSGLPFGLMGEMLQDGGNAWRGMVFGMTSRLPWAGDPRPLWKVWDAFGITDSEMIGWWVEDNPVRTGNEDILATSYVRPDKSALVALASWAKEPVDVQLAIDWKKLRIDPERAALSAPAIEGFQDAAELRPGDPIRVEPGKGLLLILR